MRPALFLLGVSLSALSGAYGMVDLQQSSTGTKYPYGSLKNALTTGVTAHATTTPVLKFKQTADNAENSSIFLDNFGQVTITGTSSSGGTTISPGSSFNDSLFHTSGHTLNLSNLTFKDFAPGGGASGGIFNGTNNAVTFNATGPVTFKNNRAIYGGAIAYAASGLTLGGAGRVTFTANQAANTGGAIYAGGNVHLTDTRFNDGDGFNGPGNTAATSGGAVSIVNSNTNFTFTTSAAGGGIIVNPSAAADVPSGQNANNDFASGDSSNKFIKDGQQTLTLNTYNSSWMGSTTVHAGSLIIGDSSHASAVWGLSPTVISSFSPQLKVPGSITVENSGTLGGYGTIYASDVTFSSLLSTWLIGINPSGTTPPCGILNMTGTATSRMLTLPTIIKIVGQLSASTPVNYPVATGYTNSLSGSTSLGVLNGQLSKYNLALSESGSASSYTLTLSQTRGTTITFTTNAKDSNNRYITNPSEGLMVQLGWPGTGSDVLDPTQPFYAVPLSWAGGTPATWTGSASLPTGTYNWKLGVTKDYLGSVFKTPETPLSVSTSDNNKQIIVKTTFTLDHS